MKNLQFVKEYLEERYGNNHICRIYLDSDFEKSAPMFVTLDYMGDDYYFGEGLEDGASEEQIISYIEKKLKEYHL